MKKINYVILFLLLLYPISKTLFAQSAHPFLIVNDSMYSEMQQRKDTSPWSTIISGAQSTFNSSNPINISTQAINSASYVIRDLCDAGALLYIIDPDNKTTYKNKIFNFLLDWEKLKKHTDYGDQWSGSVPVGMAFFISVIAYDVIYNDLSEAQRQLVEVQLAEVANDFYTGKRNLGSWNLNPWGACGTWYIFKNDARKIDAINGYKDRFNFLVNEDGVFHGSVGYAAGRLSSHSFAKSHFMDVLEFTGEDNSYYSNPRVQKFFRWLYTSSLTPNGYHVTFGDTHYKKDGMGPAVFRAHKFGEDVGKVASWRISQHGYGTKKGLLNYVLLDQPLAVPQAPSSKIYKNGGAFFVEPNTSNNSLYGALWNIKENEGHAHKDINGVSLFAYGELILRNSGYNGWGNGFGAYTWSEIHDQAWVNNVVLVDNKNHYYKTGGGIEEGFTSEVFDYACGKDGSALLTADHLRSLIMVHPQDGLNGYFILFDEISKVQPTSKANLLIHPNSNSTNVVESNKEYKWKIQPYKASSNNTHVTAFLGTEPESVEIKNGPLATGGQNFSGEYIEADYPINAQNSKHFVTIIYPSDNAHLKAEMKRLNGVNFSGAEIIQNSSISDYALESNGIDTAFDGNSSFRGLAALYRKGTTNNDFYFVRKGKYFQDSNSIKIGFESESDISLYLKGINGKIISGGTNVTFNYQGITGVKINGVEVSNLESGESWVTVYVDSGSHAINLISSPTSIDEINQKPDKFKLLQNYPNPFNPSTTIRYSLNKTAEVSLNIINVLGKNVRALVNKVQNTGSYSAQWNGKDDRSNSLSSGIYFYQLKIGSTIMESKKMVLMK